jgi:hypothetical protein
LEEIDDIAGTVSVNPTGTALVEYRGSALLAKSKARRTAASFQLAFSAGANSTKRNSASDAIPGGHAPASSSYFATPGSAA